MKKVIIVTPKLDVGGCQIALISMLKQIPKNKYEITLLLGEKNGELIKEVPMHINVRYIDELNFSSKDFILKNIKNRKLNKVISIIFNLLLMRLTKKPQSQIYYQSKILSDIDGKFDLAISYFMPGSFVEWFVINNIQAIKKIMWVHSDITRCKDLKNNRYENLCLKYDKIFGVCKSVSDGFIDMFPKTKQKVDVFYNIVDSNYMLEKANIGSSFNDNFEGIRILTIGRLSKEKGQYMIPNIVLKLVTEGYNIRWYCIGDGSLNEKLKLEITEKELDENLVLLGQKDNPYAYLKDCDIYVQPSLYEGYCTTLVEARCFNKPIVATNVSGTKEQLLDGETGFIVNINENELYEKIKILIENKNIRDKFSENLKKETIDTVSEIEKLYRIID